ncbi:MAG: aspartate kinase [Chloroflexia bacterium]|nr:aspartate kinase [Chloroflexia bacterium]
MQNRKVIKIGGSNLKQIEDVRRIAHIITSYEKAPVVVVSAFYGVTDKIIHYLNSLYTENAVDRLIGELRRLKFEYLLELISNEELRNVTFSKINNLLNELNGYLNQMIVNQKFVATDRDYVLSYGERLSATVITAVIQVLNKNCKLAFPEHIGLITDNVAGNASVDLEASKHNLNGLFDSNTIYVIPGFYGVSKQGLIRLLGRGGTDYSAAAVAYCINASALDIWKDVDGFMTGDPKHVSSPSQVNHLSYLEAAELAYFGAGILHPRTVEPLQKVKIPICIFNVNKDSATSLPQTIIDEEISIFPKVIKSLTFENQIGILCIKGPGVGFIPGILLEITKILYTHSINISSVITSQISINLLISYDEIDEAQRLIKSLDLHAVTEIVVNKEVSLIAVVGNGMTKAPGSSSKGFYCNRRRRNKHFIELIGGIRCGDLFYCG